MVVMSFLFLESIIHSNVRESQIQVISWTRYRDYICKPYGHKRLNGTFVDFVNSNCIVCAFEVLAHLRFKDRESNSHIYWESITVYRICYVENIFWVNWKQSFYRNFCFGKFKFWLESVMLRVWIWEWISGTCWSVSSGWDETLEILHTFMRIFSYSEWYWLKLWPNLQSSWFSRL